jgi:NAD(P)-dependent dehydrogenase (short-subunit alcohol dehydrogenase family)
VARSTEALNDLADSIRAMGQRAIPITCDVTVATDVATACETARTELGPIDVLVNNAGGPIFQASFLDIREEGWQRVIDLNLTSVFRFCQLIGADMVAQGSGSIINVASVCASRPWPAIAPYCVAKVGVINLTQSLAIEWGPFGVRVNVINPGWVKTEINRAYVSDDRLSALAASIVPLGRWGEPEEMVGTALWLASDSSSYVTGTTISVDGGSTRGLPQDLMRALDRSATKAAATVAPG